MADNNASASVSDDQDPENDDDNKGLSLFKKLVKKCEEMDDSKDMEVISKKLWKGFHRASVGFRGSSDFIKMVEQNIAAISENPDKKFIHIKHTLDELKANKRKDFNRSSKKDKHSSASDKKSRKSLIQKDDSSSNHSDSIKSKTNSIPADEKSSDTADSVSHPPSVKVQQQENKSSQPHSGPSSTHLPEPPSVNENNVNEETTKPNTSEHGEREDEDYDSYDSKTLKRIVFLETLLAKLHKKIKKLEAKEVNFDDQSEDEDSTYILVSKYKQRICAVYKKLCEVKKQSTKLGNQSIKFSGNSPGSKYPEINRAVEKFYNKKREFPNFPDIIKLIKQVNSEKELNFSPDKIYDTARIVFKDLGNMLKRTRQYDLHDCLTSYLPATSMDPAKSDKDLEGKLVDTEKIYKKKMEEIIDSFAEKQVESDEKEVLEADAKRLEDEEKGIVYDDKEDEDGDEEDEEDRDIEEEDNENESMNDCEEDITDVDFEDGGEQDQEKISKSEDEILVESSTQNSPEDIQQVAIENDVEDITVSNEKSGGENNASNAEQHSEVHSENDVLEIPDSSEKSADEIDEISIVEQHKEVDDEKDVLDITDSHEKSEVKNENLFNAGESAAAGKENEVPDTDNPNKKSEDENVLKTDKSVEICLENDAVDIINSNEKSENENLEVSDEKLVEVSDEVYEIKEDESRSSVNKLNLPIINKTENKEEVILDSENDVVIENLNDASESNSDSKESETSFNPKAKFDIEDNLPVTVIENPLIETDIHEVTSELEKSERDCEDVEMENVEKPDNSALKTGCNEQINNEVATENCHISSEDAHSSPQLGGPCLIDEDSFIAIKVQLKEFSKIIKEPETPKDECDLLDPSEEALFMEEKNVFIVTSCGNAFVAPKRIKETDKDSSEKCTSNGESETDQNKLKDVASNLPVVVLEKCDDLVAKYERRLRKRQKMSSDVVSVSDISDSDDSDYSSSSRRKTSRRRKRNSDSEDSDFDPRSSSSSKKKKKTAHVDSRKTAVQLFKENRWGSANDTDDIVVIDEVPGKRAKGSEEIVVEVDAGSLLGCMSPGPSNNYQFKGQSFPKQRGNISIIPINSSTKAPIIPSRVISRAPRPTPPTTFSNVRYQGVNRPTLSSKPRFFSPSTRAPVPLANVRPTLNRFPFRPSTSQQVVRTKFSPNGGLVQQRTFQTQQMNGGNRNILQQRQIVQTRQVRQAPPRQTTVVSRISPSVQLVTQTITTKTVQTVIQHKVQQVRNNVPAGTSRSITNSVQNPKRIMAAPDDVITID